MSYSVARLKEELKNKELPALRMAGLLEESSIDFLERYRRNYTPNSAPHFDGSGTAYYYHNSKTYTDLVRREVGKRLSRAVSNGNESIINHAIGLADGSGMSMDMVEYERFAQLLSEPSEMILLFGDTGSGKTYTAVKMGEIWKLRVDGLVMTNIKSLAESVEGIEYIDNYPDIIHFCLEHPKVRKLYIADELSSLMSGYAGDAHYVESLMRPLVRKKRKEPFKLSLIGIGHRPGDIHPTMRNPELADFAFKEGESRNEARRNMTVYQRISSGEEGEGEICSLSGISLPSWNVDTNDDGLFEWGTEEQIREAADALAEEYGDFLRLDSAIARLFGEDEDDSTDDAALCQAETNEGRPCPATATYPSEDPLVCTNHRHRLDDIQGEE